MKYWTLILHLHTLICLIKYLDGLSCSSAKILDTFDRSSLRGWKLSGFSQRHSLMCLCCTSCDFWMLVLRLFWCFFCSVICGCSYLVPQAAGRIVSFASFSCRQWRCLQQEKYDVNDKKYRVFFFNRYLP